MSEKCKIKKYDESFKEETIKLVLQQGQGVSSFQDSEAVAVLSTSCQF